MTDIPLTKLSAEEINEFVTENFATAEKKPEQPINKKICLAVLSYDGRMECRTSLCLAQAMAACGARGWGFTYILREADSMVARGRSFLASQFLTNPGTKDCTDLVFIDTDLDFKAEDFISLCDAPVEVIGGAYPYKDESGDFPLRWPSEGLFEENGLWVVQAVTPGFFRVSRKALEKIARETPWIEFNDRGKENGQRYWMFFDNLQRPGGVYDEGYVFCEHWRRCGGKVYLNPEFVISHIGKKAYKHGSLRDWLDRKSKMVEKLEAEFPNIPPLALAAKAFGAKIDLAAEAAKLGGDESFGPVVSGVAA